MSVYSVASAVKARINEKGFMSSGDLPEGVSKAIEAILDKACERARLNGRKTVRPEDL